MAPSGEIFVATGNGASATVFDHSNSVEGLTPSLSEVGFFAPTDWVQLNQQDTDLGSVGPALLSNGTIFQIGKGGVGYLLNSTDLGGIGGELFSAPVCSGAYGGTANAGKLVFIPCSEGLVALEVSGDMFTVLWRSPTFRSGPPIITGGIVWTLDTANGTLHGFDASTGRSVFSFGTGTVTRFTTPTYAYGEVLVAAGETVYSFRIGTAVI